MPEPHPNEKKDAFISRCIGDPESNKTFPDQKQRIAFCYSQWDRKNKKGNLRPVIRYSQRAWAQKLFSSKWAMKQTDLNSLALKCLGWSDNDFDNDEDVDTVEPSTIITNGVCIIPIFGVLVKHMQGEGVVNYDWIRSQVHAASTNPEIRSILLFWHSPGGEVLGGESIADCVAEYDKITPLYSYTEGMMCSMAYWIGSQARGIYSSVDSDVGAVGVFSNFPNIKGMLDKQGIIMEKFASHPDKIAGQPWNDPMDDKHKEMFQADITEEYDKFLAAVRSKRNIPEDRLTGWDYSGAKALEYGFVDGILPSLEDMVEFISEG